VVTRGAEVRARPSSGAIIAIAHLPLWPDGTEGCST
jgi:hypothetical protein